MMGGHLVRSWSKDQIVVAVSSGEAELYAANYGAAQALGMQSMARDMGAVFEINLLIDASAAMGIINRQGLGKVRHIETQDLWLQQTVRSRKVPMQKVDSGINEADLMTKPLTVLESEKHMKNMNLRWW